MLALVAVQHHFGHLPYSSGGWGRMLLIVSCTNDRRRG